LATAIIAAVIPIRTTANMIPIDCLLPRLAGVYGRVAACIKPMQMVVMHKLRIAPPIHHRTIPFFSVYPRKPKPAAAKIDNR
jgi:hypothetical protein